MAHQATGNVPTHRGMQDPTQSNLARDGAAKSPQKNFPITHGMTDQTDASKLRGFGDHRVGFNEGADASSPNPLDPSPQMKKFSEAPIKWGMRDANGKSINGNGSAVLSEASVLGK